MEDFNHGENQRELTSYKYNLRATVTGELILRTLTKLSSYPHEFLDSWI
jgi:hypothetical protein